MISRLISQLAKSLKMPILQPSNKFLKSQWAEESQKMGKCLSRKATSLGVPARLMLGSSYVNGAEVTQAPSSHVWVEAYAPATGW